MPSKIARKNIKTVKMNSINFAKISKLTFEETNIIITYMSGEKKIIDLNKIDINSKKRLEEILKSTN